MSVSQLALIFLFWITTMSTVSWLWMSQSEAHFNQSVDSAGMFIVLTATCLWLATVYLIQRIKDRQAGIR